MTHGPSTDTDNNTAPSSNTDDYGTVTPYLVVPGVDRLLTYLEQAFGAETRLRKDRPDGTVMHAEVKIGNSIVMMGEPTGPFNAMPGSIYLYVDDCDAVYARALAAGGVSTMEVTSMEHAGQRYGGVRDPSGNVWWVASRIASA